MLKLALGIFIVGAFFGATALKFILKNKKAPKAIGMIHGSLMLIALLVTISVSASGQGVIPWFSLVFFTLAALGGVTIFILDTKKRPVPKAIGIIHPLFGLTGIISLIIFVIQH